MLTTQRVPTIVWQFSWNYIFGPYLLWKIRMIKDIYRWRLQTTLAIIAGYVRPVFELERELTVVGFLEHPYGWQLYTAINSQL